MGSMDPNGVIAAIYRPRIDEHFREHPRHDEIMAAYDRGDAPPELWDIWYSEVESILWKKMGDRAQRAMPDEDGYVHFKVIDNRKR